MARRHLQIALFLVVALAAGTLATGCASANPYQGMGADEVFERAMQEFEDEDWDEAVRAFERVLFSFPTFERAPEARFHLAESHYQNGEYITATNEFNRFIDRYPIHELAPDAALGMCRSYAALSPRVQRDQEHTRRAHSTCSNAAADYPDTEAGQRAAELRDEMWEKLAEKIYIGGEFYFDRDLYDSALIYFEDVVDNYPDTRAAPKALRKMVEAYEEIGYDEEAVETRERLMEEYPDSEAARELEERRGNGR